MACFFQEALKVPSDTWTPWLRWARWALLNCSITHGLSIKVGEWKKNTRALRWPFKIGSSLLSEWWELAWTSVCGMGLSSRSVFTGVRPCKRGNTQSKNTLFFSPSWKQSVFTDCCVCPFRKPQSTPEPTLHNLENPRKSTLRNSETFPWELFLYSC